jgi:repressor LexA
MILTSAQKEVFDFIFEYCNKNKIAPTLREIKDGLGFAAHSYIVEHIKNLEKKGLLNRDENKWRGLSLTPLAYKYMKGQ